MILNESTFHLYCAKHYDNPHCSSLEEFEEDLNRIKYIQKLFNRYKQTGEINERLVLNHIIILYNCFGVHASPILFMKLEKYHSCLKTFVEYLHYLPAVIEYDDKKIDTSKIKEDIMIKNLLKTIGESK